LTPNKLFKGTVPPLAGPPLNAGVGPDGELYSTGSTARQTATKPLESAAHTCVHRARSLHLACAVSVSTLGTSVGPSRRAGESRRRFGHRSHSGLLLSAIHRTSVCSAHRQCAGPPSWPSSKSSRWRSSSAPRNVLRGKPVRLGKDGSHRRAPCSYRVRRGRYSPVGARLNA
jgi:hypothetical protein